MQYGLQVRGLFVRLSFPATACTCVSSTTVRAPACAHESGSHGVMWQCQAPRPFALSGPPIVNQNYLQTKSDLTDLVDAFKNARRVAGSKAFDTIRGAELLPGPEVETDDEIKAYLRASACHFWGSLVGYVYAARGLSSCRSFKCHTLVSNAEIKCAQGMCIAGQRPATQVFLGGG